MNKNENIRFVRIRGKVVPIKTKGNNESYKPRKRNKPKKMKDSTKFALQSGAFTLGGIFASIGSARLFSGTLKKAEEISQQSFDFAMDKNFSKLPKGIKSSSHGAIKAGKMLKRAPKFKMAGQLLGGALLSQGVQRALRSQGVEIDNPIIDVGAEAGSQLAAHLISRESKKAFGMNKKFSVKAPSGLRKIAKTLGTRFIKKQLRFKF